MYLSRSDWGAAAPVRTLPPLNRSNVRYWTVHYDGAAALAGRDPRSLLRAWQRYHTGTRTFADLAYNSAVFQNGDRAEGRGSFVGGHLLSNAPLIGGGRGNQNALAWGVIAGIGKNEEPTPLLLDALREDYAAACAWADRELIINGHTDWPNANKPCPGKLVPFIRSGALKPAESPVATTPLPAPAPAAPASGRRLLKLTTPHMRGADVRSLQAFALRVFPSYARGIARAGGADGVYGKATADWVREFQRRARLGVDGKVGPRTWAKLEAFGYR